MWACACVLAEAASGDILFNGDSDIGQLFKIFEILGSPGPGKHMAWAGVEALPFYQPIFPNMRPRDLATHPLTAPLCASPAAADLLRQMLIFDPRERLTAADALAPPFFASETPLPPPASPPPKALGARAADAAAAAASAAACARAAASAAAAF